MHIPQKMHDETVAQVVAEPEIVVESVETTPLLLWQLVLTETY